MLLVLPTTLRAQQVTLTDVVVDTVAGTSAPCAVVEIRARRVGVQATTQGTFAPDLSGAPAAIASLRDSSLGFVPRILAVPLISPCRLGLQPLAVALPGKLVVRATLVPLTRSGPVENGTDFGVSDGES